MAQGITKCAEFGVYGDRDEAFRVCAGLRAQGYDAGVCGGTGERIEHVDPTQPAPDTDAHLAPAPEGASESTPWEAGVDVVACRPRWGWHRRGVPPAAVFCCSGRTHSMFAPARAG
jgi:hypothetical protein